MNIQKPKLRVKPNGVQQFLLLGMSVLFLLMSSDLFAAEKVDIKTVPLGEQFLHHIRYQFDENAKNYVMPKSLVEWESHRKKLYDQLSENIGLIKEKQCELQPRKVGEIKQDGYRIEKILLNTFPDIQVPVLAYVPEGEGPFPAVLCVHGHWKGAKQEPAIQSRCIGLAKLGFFVLAVDAFGAGERAIGKALGEYHGASVAASLFASGLMLPGLQIYENSRFVDYLETRKEVIKDKIGITGASGGGNQSMYAGAMEERFKCVVPVCSVGSYRAYLGVACCYCELFPGAMKLTEEWALLSMVAPRALMVINASKDSIQFSPGEAKKSIANSKPVFLFYGKEKYLKHLVFDCGHDYNKEMREAMYGWMTLHLKGEGTGEPIPEPVHETLDREKLRIFPGESRPDGLTNLIQFANIRSREMVRQRNKEWNSSSFKKQKKELKEAFELKLNSHYSKNTFSSLKTEKIEQTEENGEDKISLTVSPERGIQIAAEYSKGETNQLVVVIDLEDDLNEKLKNVSESLIQKGWNVMTPELRGTKQRKVARDRIRNAMDHNSVEWSLWNGLPLLGQWVTDIRSLIDVAEKLENKTFDEVVLVGNHSGGMVALSSGILDDRVTRVVTLNMLSSFIPNSPIDHDRLGILVPGILKDVGDVSHLCSLYSPRKLFIIGGHLTDGKALDQSSLEKEFSIAKKTYGWTSQSDQLKIKADWNVKESLRWIEDKEWLQSIKNKNSFQRIEEE